MKLNINLNESRLVQNMLIYVKVIIYATHIHIYYIDDYFAMISLIYE